MGRAALRRAFGQPYGTTPLAVSCVTPDQPAAPSFVDFVAELRTRREALGIAWVRDAADAVAVGCALVAAGFRHTGGPRYVEPGRTVMVVDLVHQSAGGVAWWWPEGAVLSREQLRRGGFYGAWPFPVDTGEDRSEHNPRPEEG